MITEQPTASGATAHEPRNPLRRRWAAGETARGAWVLAPSPYVAEALAAAGVDYVCLDMQHGMLDYVDVVPMVAAVHARGAVPIVRVPAGAPWLIGKVLDAGAGGVIVPMVETADDAAAAVAEARYAPVGRRSYGPARASVLHGTTDPAELSDVVVAVMVETRRGVDRVTEIAATPGLDAVYVGPADLSISLGLPPVFEHADGEHPRALERVRAACAESGIVAGVHCPDGAAARRRLEQGFRMVNVATDLELVRAGTAEQLRVSEPA
ncbi:HpcH/HpaI aldolase family protein [Ornithinicoccus halotolerans]|uniref:HpcH/HpaI aldolase family protein n=1 Tax=Ornithinicoccus halotolerans TaxID=1748220 RepID=UPI0012974267|nr:aldolase/citrate lyase family protein [Ornithinicoccus halotolerans]